MKKFYKIYSKILDETKDLSKAQIMSYIIDEMLYKKSDTVQIKQTYLMEIFYFSKYQLSNILNFLEKEKYITFIRSNYHNLTTTQFYLLEKGQTLLDSIKADLVNNKKKNAYEKCTTI